MKAQQAHIKGYNSNDIFITSHSNKYGNEWIIWVIKDTQNKKILSSGSIYYCTSWLAELKKIENYKKQEKNEIL